MDSINSSTFSFWKNQKGPILVGAPTFEIQWDGPLKFELRPPPAPMGMHLVDVCWQDVEGKILWRVPDMDAYVVRLVARAVFVPNKAGMSAETVRDIIMEQVVAGVKTAFLLTPTPWKVNMKDANQFPSTMFYSQQMFSGLQYQMAKKSPAEMAKLACHVGDLVAKQLINFLTPRIMAGATHDWSTDPEVTISYPIPFQGKPLVWEMKPDYKQTYKVITKEDADATGGLQVSAVQQTGS